MTAVESEPIANPFSTGGGGTTFELKTQASILVSLLVRAYAPGCDASPINEILLQAEYAGYKTDDVVVVSGDTPTSTRKQLWSVKHEVKFTNSDLVLREVLSDAWADFENTALFDAGRDMIVLATRPVPSTYRNLLTLLEIMRSTASYDDFQAKLSREGFLSQGAKNYFELFKSLSQELAPTKPNAQTVWEFMRCFHVLSFDFDQTFSKDETMSKTLLGLAARAGTGSTGEELWNRMFKWVAEANPRAGSFTRDSLPEAWRRDTTSIKVQFESGVISRLLDHTKLTLKRVRSTIGAGFHLPRSIIVDELAIAFDDFPITIVSGEAGVGKSAAAWMALQKAVHGSPLFVFQAKEFAHDHLDKALADMRIHESMPRISSLFGLHRRKFILLESVERLLEAHSRDAFSDLLAYLADDPTWRVVMTCREHSMSLVKETFLTPYGLRARTVVVNRITEGELDSALNSRPDLRSLVLNERTRYFLRNPWFLDKACSINWPDAPSGIALDQRQLREILWRQIVARDEARIGGIHRKRDRVFREIALARARSMKSFVAPVPGEEAAVQALLADELLVEDAATEAVAPAHDVLEDWALVRWMAEQFDSFGDVPAQFFNGIGHHLPIRRAYRHWLHECLGEDDLTTVRRFTDAVLSNDGLPSYWRDETVVSLLLSEDAGSFVAGHELRLLQRNKEQLQVIIHLMRLACKQPNPLWVKPEHLLAETFGDLHLVPSGSSWPAVIKLIHRNLDQFDTQDLPYLLGLLEDWKLGCNWQNPLPQAAAEVGLISIHFWQSLDDEYRWEKELKRLLEVALWTTLAVPKEFESLVQKAMAQIDIDGDKNYRVEILSKKLLASFDGAMAIRSHPLLIATAARKIWRIDRAPPSKSIYGGHSLDMNGHFGLPFSLYDNSPASSIQGPFHVLFQAAPEIAFDLILDLINVTTERYVAGGLDSRYDAPTQIDLNLGDGVVCRQWVSPRLWLLFRGSMPGPDIVESALMALEQYLLSIASSNDIGHIARDLMVRSSSVAITSVIASVSMAHPESVGDVVLTLFREPVLYELDLSRCVHDQSYFDMGDWALDSIQKIHHKERLNSSKMPHRRQSLESLALKLQVGPLRDDIWSIIDGMNADIAAISDQSDNTKLFRLKLHRMDIRNFVAQERLTGGAVLYAARPAAPDIIEVVQKSAPMLQSSHHSAELIVWGMSVFEGRDSDKYRGDRWRDMLLKAQQLKGASCSSDDSWNRSNEGGPAYVAAVCVRDYWTELSNDDKQWCRDLLLQEIDRNKDSGDEMMRSQRHEMSGQVAAARVIPLLIGASDEPIQEVVTTALAGALTHSVLEVRSYTASAIGAFLWERNPRLASACLTLLFGLANVERERYAQWRAQDWQDRIGWEDFIALDVSKLRDKFLADDLGGIENLPLGGLDSDISSDMLRLIASIVAGQQDLTVAHQIYTYAAKHLASRWRVPGSGRSSADSRDHHSEAALRRQYGDFVVRCGPSIALNIWRPFAGAIEENSAEVAKVFNSLVGAQDACSRTEGFWAIWNETKDVILAFPNCLERLSRPHSGLSSLASALLFDGIEWKQDARDWKPIHGHETEIRNFVEQAAAAPSVCRSFVRLLGGIGHSLVPEALIWLADIIRRDHSRSLIGGKNELFVLACILTPLVFGRSSSFRNSTVLRDSVLEILDEMVAKGSAAAYRMRDALII